MTILRKSLHAYHALALSVGQCKPTLDGRCWGCAELAQLEAEPAPASVQEAGVILAEGGELGYLEPVESARGKYGHVASMDVTLRWESDGDHTELCYGILSPEFDIKLENLQGPNEGQPARLSISVTGDLGEVAGSMDGLEHSTIVRLGLLAQEWLKGCSNAEASPAECDDCTTAFLDALQNAARADKP